MNKKNFNSIYIASRFIFFAISTNAYADINPIVDIGGIASNSQFIATEESRRSKVTFEKINFSPTRFLIKHNKYYAYFKNHFIDFDINKKIFIRIKETNTQISMGIRDANTKKNWAQDYPEDWPISYVYDLKLSRVFFDSRHYKNGMFSVENSGMFDIEKINKERFFLNYNIRS